MRIHAIWHGGNGYAPSDLKMDVEAFNSIANATHAFRERAESTGRSLYRFNFVNRQPESVALPAVDGQTTSMDIYAGPISEGESASGEPWFRLRLNRFGTVVRENY